MLTWVKDFRIIPEFRILRLTSIEMLNLADYESSHLLSLLLISYADIGESFLDYS